MRSQQIDEYHVFIASPGDVGAERAAVRDYFDDLNRTTGQALRVRFQVVDWENFATAGIGRPQELITRQTLERFRDSLALVIVVMAQRFGTPTGTDESGTEEEVRWAVESNAASGFPEVKFFFRDIEQFIAPPDPDQILEAVEQWKRVRRFRAGIEESRSALFQTYPGPESFASVLRRDLDTWVNGPGRPWARAPAAAPAGVAAGQRPPQEYFQRLVHAYQWLDISGIDSDRAFKLPLNQIYVRLRVISSDGDGDGDDGDGDGAEEGAAIGIQTALERHQRLAIVGDPGSGKSTFLRFIALVLAQCELSADPRAAEGQLSLTAPLPVPLFLSCWDLAEHLKQQRRASLDDVVEFGAQRAREAGWQVSRADLEAVLRDGLCVLLIDGLDEVPTDEGRHLVSGLIEELVVKYPQHRYVVTSRVRAYTGETVLGQQFARCDIQPFAAEERNAFLRNWVDQLFKIRNQADPGGGAAAELSSLTEAIETSSIRSLATNPLLLTVIAIVHWNRKRLPEQRVELYDECVDVLLGQRKQAEQQRTSRDTRFLDEEYAEKRHEQQVWIRKRFAEIAFAILSRSDEEIDRAAVVALLESHFRGKGTAEQESREKAERFLHQQEIRSGLLVRRQAGSYRFVHLTFQEYLAAWHLANRELASTLEVIGPHVRDPKWFETLQLLGGALANRSDEYLDTYIGFLLDGAGETLREQAPLIALCANVVRDTQSVAELSGKARTRYETLIRSTFAAFEPQSRVPRQTQLDLLEALGSLGASAKFQLISATRSGLLAIRRRALEMLVPHLPDDDLFAMTHVLADRSKEPIKTYVNAIVDRDRTRAARAVLQLSCHGDKTLDALAESASPKLPADGIANWPELVWRSWMWSGFNTALGMLVSWEDHRDETRNLIARLAQQGSAAAIGVLMQLWGDRDETWDLIAGLDDQAVGRLAREYPGRVWEFAERWGDREQTWELVARLAQRGASDAITLLVQRRGDRRETWELLTRLAGQGSAPAISALMGERADLAQASELIERLDDQGVRRLLKHNQFALWNLTQLWGDRAQTWELMTRLARRGFSEAMTVLAQQEGDRDETWELLAQLGREGSMAAVLVLIQQRGDHEQTWELLARLALQGNSEAFTLLVQWRGDRDETWELLASLDDQAIARLAQQGRNVLWSLEHGQGGGREQAWELITRLARQGSDGAITLLAERRGDRERTWELINRLARHGSAGAIRMLATKRGDREETWELITSLARQGSAVAIGALAQWRGGRAQTWELIAGLDDEAIERLEHQDHYVAWNLVQRWGGREPVWDFVARLARLGSTGSINVLAQWWGGREQTWELITRLAQQGSADAINALIQWRGGRDQTWEVIAGLDDQAIRRLVQQPPHHSFARDLAQRWGGREQAWELIERLASMNSSEARSFLAWRDWAAATTGSGDSG